MTTSAHDHGSQAVIVRACSACGAGLQISHDLREQALASPPTAIETLCGECGERQPVLAPRACSECGASLRVDRAQHEEALASPTAIYTLCICGSWQPVLPWHPLLSADEQNEG
jgi:hypothetical protein